MIGSIVAVSDLNVKVLLDKADSVVVGDVLEAVHNNKKYVFEIVEINENIAKVIPFESVMFLKKGIPVSKSSKKLSIEYSDNILGRVYLVFVVLIIKDCMDWNIL